MVLSLLGSVAEAVIRCLTVVAGYVTNSSTFPQPLSEEEEARYLARLRLGDDEARSILIERNLRLVAHIVNTLDAKSQVVAVQGEAHTGRIVQAPPRVRRAPGSQWSPSHE